MRRNNSIRCPNAKMWNRDDGDGLQAQSRTVRVGVPIAPPPIVDRLDAQKEALRVFFLEEWPELAANSRINSRSFLCSY